MGLLDAELDLDVEVGATVLTIDALRGLNRGTILPVERPGSDAVRLNVNERLFAHAELTAGERQLTLRIRALAR